MVTVSDHPFFLSGGLILDDDAQCYFDEADPEDYLGRVAWLLAEWDMGGSQDVSYRVTKFNLDAMLVSAKSPL